MAINCLDIIFQYASSDELWDFGVEIEYLGVSRDRR